MELTLVISLGLGLIAISLLGMFSYSEHKTEQIMTSMLREVYATQMKVINTDPAGAAGVVALTNTMEARALVCSQLRLTNSSSSLGLSLSLRNTFQYTRNGIQYCVWVPRDLKQYPVWTTYADFHNINPPIYDPSGSLSDKKYDLGDPNETLADMP